jgi:hypothetical protein
MPFSKSMKMLKSRRTKVVTRKRRTNRNMKGFRRSRSQRGGFGPATYQTNALPSSSVIPLNGNLNNDMTSPNNVVAARNLPQLGGKQPRLNRQFNRKMQRGGRGWFSDVFLSSNNDSSSALSAGNIQGSSVGLNAIYGFNAKNSSILSNPLLDSKGSPYV